MSSVRLVALFAVLVLTLAASPGVAEVPWSLAFKTDTELVATVGALSDDAPGADSAVAVTMLREVGWEILPGSRLLYRNVVLRVRDAAALADVASSFYLDARGEIESAQAFRVRDGVLTRLPVQLDRGDGAVRRARLRVVDPELAAGDILGLSTITRFDNILYFDRVALGSRFPVAQFSLRVRCEEKHGYAIRAENHPGLDVQVVEESEGRPVEWQARAASIAAIEGFRGAGPYAPGTPLALVAESSEFVPAANAWIETLAWQRVALYLSGIREAAVSSMIGAWERAPEAIGTAATDAQKEAAIFAYVRDRLDLMVGEKFDPLGHRSADEVFESGQATPMEQAMIMVTLLAAAGVPGEIAVVRTGPWGPLDDQFQSFVQFQDVAVRCGRGDDLRYYVTYVDDAPAPGLPAAWGTSWVLAPAPGLMPRVSEAAGKVMSTPNVDVQAAFARLRAEAQVRGWFTLEQVDASR